MEQDEVDIRHETVSSHGRRINLKKMSGRVNETVYGTIVIPANPFSSS